MLEGGKGKHVHSTVCMLKWWNGLSSFRIKLG